MRKSTKNQAQISRSACSGRQIFVIWSAGENHAKIKLKKVKLNCPISISWFVLGSSRRVGGGWRCQSAIAPMSSQSRCLLDQSHSRIQLIKVCVEVSWREATFHFSAQRTDFFQFSVFYSILQRWYLRQRELVVNLGHYRNSDDYATASRTREVIIVLFT